MAETLARNEDRYWKGRVEIDTSAPFESVKEAVTRFEGSAISTKPPQTFRQIPKISDEELLSIKEQTENLEKELAVKERETLDVLKELEATKMAVDGLKMKIKAEAADISEKNLDSGSSNPSPPSLILMELQQAKVNLTRATGGLVDIRASIESLSKEIENERAVIEETRERISSNSSKIMELEKELHQTRLMIQFARDDGANCGSSYPPYISLELHKLNSRCGSLQRRNVGGRRSEEIRGRYASKSGGSYRRIGIEPESSSRGAGNGGIDKSGETRGRGSATTLAIGAQLPAEAPPCRRRIQGYAPTDSLDRTDTQPKTLRHLRIRSGSVVQVEQSSCSAKDLARRDAQPPPDFISVPPDLRSLQICSQADDSFEDEEEEA